MAKRIQGCSPYFLYSSEYLNMERHHLTAWREHAPWTKRSQVEQDLRLARGVVAIFEDTVLREHLAMRGGTVLHKGHLAPAARYSEDIDLVLTKSMSAGVAWAAPDPRPRTCIR